MKHDIKELYHINRDTKLYTKDYIEANDIQQATRQTRFNEGWIEAHYTTSSRADKSKTVITSQGTREIYLYGEKTWFDTKAERDAYRQQMNQEREQLLRRSKAMKTINDYLATLSTDDLEDLIQGLN